MKLHVNFRKQLYQHSKCLALRKIRFNNKFGPHLWKRHEEKTDVGIVYVYYLLCRMDYFFHFRELNTRTIMINI